MADTLELSQDVRALVERLRTLEPELRAAGVTGLALFGSRARGDHRPDSDLDLLIQVDEGSKFSLFDLVGVTHIVEDCLGVSAHAAMRRSLTPDFARRIQDEIVEVF